MGEWDVKKEGQGSLELLLLIAGAVLVTVVILLIGISSSQGQNMLIENGIFQYIESTQDAAGLSGGGLGDPGYVPECLNGIIDPTEQCDLGAFAAPFAPDGVGKCTLFNPFSGGDLVCDSDCKIDPQFCTPIIPPQIVSFSGDWYDGKTQLFYDVMGTGILTYELTRTNPDGSTTILSPEYDSKNFLDETVSNGNDYFYSLEACDATGLCSVSNSVGPLTPHVPNVSFSLSGPTTIVFDYTFDKCGSDGLDLPDNTATAVWTGSELILDAANAPTVYLRRSTVGPNYFDTLKSDCALSNQFSSTKDTQPQNSDNYEWINAIYKKGDTLYGLIHQEFHDTVSQAICGPNWQSQAPDNPCWYNTITMVTSNDDGKTFTQLSSPDHIVADPPLAWDAAAMKQKPYGYMNPTNIISRVEGGTIVYYYSFFTAQIGVGTQDPTSSGICLMRTDNLDIPSSWRAWDGDGFDIPMIHPYNGANPIITNEPNCAYIHNTSLANITGHVTFNTFLQEYIMVGIGAKNDTYSPILPKPVKCGMWYARSKDLITWTPHKLVFESQFPNNQAQCTANSLITSYGSMIDQDQINDPTDPNFEKSDDTFHLYYTVFNNPPTYSDRDLVRRPVTLTKT